MAGDYADMTAFKKLQSALRPNKKWLFYLALPPEASRCVLFSLQETGLATDSALVMIEKPFGIGFDDAFSLAAYINKAFKPHQCLKVDHYAGKRELRAFHAEDAVDPTEIAAITVQIFETATTEHRKGFYDNVGELRDIGQNHLLFMLATVLTGKNGAGSREEALTQLVPDPDPSTYLFARYEGSHGKETFFSVLARCINPKLRHIRILLRAGKALSKDEASILITYRSGKEKKIILSSGPEAYELILKDALEGRRESFLSDQEVLSAWKFIETIEKVKEKKEIICYPIGYDQRFFNEKDVGASVQERAE